MKTRSNYPQRIEVRKVMKLLAQLEKQQVRRSANEKCLEDGCGVVFELTPLDGLYGRSMLRIADLYHITRAEH
jgi:hypothetical protein